MDHFKYDQSINIVVMGKMYTIFFKVEQIITTEEHDLEEDDLLHEDDTHEGERTLTMLRIRLCMMLSSLMKRTQGSLPNSGGNQQTTNTLWNYTLRGISTGGGCY